MKVRVDRATIYFVLRRLELSGYVRSSVQKVGHDCIYTYERDGQVLTVRYTQNSWLEIL